MSDILPVIDYPCMTVFLSSIGIAVEQEGSRKQDVRQSNKQGSTIASDLNQGKA